MASVNKTIILGNVSQDPQIRYGASGNAVCNLSIATNRYWKDKQGERQEEVEFHRVVLYDRLAEIAGEYLKKGSSCYIEGRLKTRKWQDKEGIDRYTTEIIADQLQLLGSRGETQARPASGSYEAAKNGTRPASQPTGFEDMEDDMPPF